MKKSAQSTKQVATDSSTFQAKAKNQANDTSILQAYKEGTAQLAAEEEPAQLKENKTGLPDNLKSGVENLSGHSMDDVKVHYNSTQPATLQAHAYAQGTDIHVAPGQEKHLPHEAWHVVQQKEGRVQPTKQLKGKTNINDDAGLEKEADVMGSKAHSNGMEVQQIPVSKKVDNPIVQGVFTGPQFTTDNPVATNFGGHQFITGALQKNTNCGSDNQIITDGQRKNSGASAPGSPTNLATYKDGFSRSGGLVRDPVRNQTSTRLHLINHRLENSGNTQNVSSNILLGSQKANNPTHLHRVENHVIRSLSHASEENADYENSLGQAQSLTTDVGTAVTYWDPNNIPPVHVLPLRFHNDGWLDANGDVTNLPPVNPTKKKKLNNGTASVNPPGVYINPLTKALPKHLWLDYEVIGNYQGAPNFVQGNIDHERQQNGGAINPVDQNIEDDIQDFENTWKDNAFPTNFDSEATYYFASWIPGTPYHADNEATETIPTDL